MAYLQRLQSFAAVASMTAICYSAFSELMTLQTLPNPFGQRQALWASRQSGHQGGDIT
jgi:hypothetical protein